MCPQTGRAVGIFSFHTDDHAHRHGAQQSQTDANNSKLHKTPPQISADWLWVPVDEARIDPQLPADDLLAAMTGFLF
jgi:hypothetical protein